MQGAVVGGFRDSLFHDDLLACFLFLLCLAAPFQHARLLLLLSAAFLFSYFCFWAVDLFTFEGQHGNKYHDTACFLGFGWCIYMYRTNLIFTYSLITFSFHL